MYKCINGKCIKMTDEEIELSKQEFKQSVYKKSKEDIRKEAIDAFFKGLATSDITSISRIRALAKEYVTAMNGESGNDEV